MKDFYAEHPKLYVALDCIIFGFEDEELKLLVIRRSFQPAKGKWSLMGGMLQENESLDEAAYRILYKLTGLKNLYMRQLYASGETQRDPGARVVSVSYYALVNVKKQNKDLIRMHSAQWKSFHKLPNLIFDHNSMVEMALERLRKDAKIKPIGFELLPHKFTLPQLQSLYEAIYMKKLDKRNFRKNILSMGLLEKYPEKDKGSSKKGAYFYSFNKIKYEELTSKGFYFNFLV